MKEINLQDLLNLADASAHDGICDFWNQKSHHYLVIFTSTQEDFEIIGVGPGLPHATLEDAGHHLIPGKKPEFYVKCPAAVVKRLAPKLGSVTHQPVPSMKGRTSGPFIRPGEAAPAPGPASTPAAPAAVATPPPSPPPTLSPSAAALTAEQRDLLKNYAERLAALDAREHALAERAAELDRREEQLKIPAS